MKYVYLHHVSGSWSGWSNGSNGYKNKLNNKELYNYILKKLFELVLRGQKKCCRCVNVSCLLKVIQDLKQIRITQNMAKVFFLNIIKSTFFKDSMDSIFIITCLK